MLCAAQPREGGGVRARRSQESEGYCRATATQCPQEGGPVTGISPQRCRHHLIIGRRARDCKYHVTHCQARPGTAMPK